MAEQDDSKGEIGKANEGSGVTRRWDDLMALDWLKEQGLPSINSEWAKKNPSALATFIKFLEMMHHQKTGFDGPEDYEQLGKQLMDEIESQLDKVWAALDQKQYGETVHKSMREKLTGKKKKDISGVEDLEFGLIHLSNRTDLATVQKNLFDEMKDFLKDGTQIWYDTWQWSEHWDPDDKKTEISEELSNDNKVMGEALRQVRLMQMYQDGELFIKTKEAADGKDAEFVRLTSPEDAKRSIDAGLLYNRYGESLEQAQEIAFSKRLQEKRFIYDHANKSRSENPEAVDQTIYRYHDAILSGATLDELTYEHFAGKFDVFMGKFEKPVMRDLFGGEIFKALPSFAESPKAQQAADTLLAMQVKEFDDGGSTAYWRLREEYQKEQGIPSELKGDEFVHKMRGFEGWVHRKRLQLAAGGLLALPEKAGDAPADLEGHKQEKYISQSWLAHKGFEFDFLKRVVDLAELKITGLYPQAVLLHDSGVLAKQEEEYDKIPQEKRTLGASLGFGKQHAWYNATKPQTPTQEEIINTVRKKAGAIAALLAQHPQLEAKYKKLGFDKEKIWAEIDQAVVGGISYDDRYFAPLHKQEKGERAYQALGDYLTSGNYMPTEEDQAALKKELEAPRNLLFGNDFRGENTESGLRKHIPAIQAAKSLITALEMLKEKKLFIKDEMGRLANLSRFQEKEFEKLPSTMTLCDAEGMPLLLHEPPEDNELELLVARMRENKPDERSTEEKYPLTLQGTAATTPEPMLLGALYHWNVENIFEKALESFGLEEKSVTMKALMHGLGSDIPHIYGALEGPKKGTQHLEGPSNTQTYIG